MGKLIATTQATVDGRADFNSVAFRATPLRPPSAASNIRICRDPLDVFRVVVAAALVTVSSCP